MKINPFVALHYTWGNRRMIASHEGYADYLRRCPEQFDTARYVAQARQAGPYPTGDHDWHYDFTRQPMHDKLLDQYRLDEIVGQGTTVERALRLMDWLTVHSCYNGAEIRASYKCQGKRETSDRLLRYTHDGGFARAINCKHKAFVLVDLCLAAGIFAMPLSLMNLPHCHVVAHIWLDEEARWIMLDPSLNAYITDEEGRALHAIEIQNRRCAGEELHIARYDFNGTQDCRDIYLDNFILACLLEIGVFHGNNTKRKDPQWCLTPKGITPHNTKTKTINATQLLAPPKT